MDAKNRRVGNPEGDVTAFGSALRGSPSQNSRLIFEHPRYGVLTELPRGSQFGDRIVLLDVEFLACLGVETPVGAGLIDSAGWFHNISLAGAVLADDEPSARSTWSFCKPNSRFGQKPKIPGRAYPHRIPLAGLTCMSDKLPRELEVCFWDL